jgi:sialate O-acetylesterase
MRNRRSAFSSLTALLLAAVVGRAAAVPQKDLPKEDVIEVPAIGQGLFVHNLFQSNMVLQRDKPVPIWGWADPDETVTVTFAGQTQTAIAGKDRMWKVVLIALKANTEPQNLTVQGKEKTLTLENILVGGLWVLGGQSNMEFPIGRDTTTVSTAPKARFSTTRSFPG